MPRNDAKPATPVSAGHSRSELLADRLLDWVVDAVRERKNPQGILQRLFRWFRYSLVWATLAYLMGLAVFLATLEWYGERNLVLWYLLYVPPQVWLFPLVFLSPLCLLFRPRLLWLHAACLFLVVFLYMQPRWSRWDFDRADTVTILTNNIGQKNGTSVSSFIRQEDPDVIALQEASGAGPAYARDYPDRQVAAQGEFVLISRFPIVASGLVEQAQWGGHPVAAWFELDIRGRKCVVYNVHLPTPRSELTKLRGRGMVYEAARSRAPVARGSVSTLRRSLAARLELARQLAQQLSSDRRPILIAGDFNVPDHGYTYHLFASRFTDTFARKGRGFGLTFPGVTKNPISLFGPWLRLDYVFAGQDWVPVYGKTESRRHSQHRGVVARCRLRSGG